MAQKPNIPKGTRDFNPEQVAKRQYIFSTIRTAFETFGFQPIETPSFENSGTLMGKYGEEGDRLIFKILNSGDYLSKADKAAYEEKNSNKLTSSISEKALRYDLTVPFARYVVQHQNEIEFPFKRYQIQPVWRADRPQKGRFREFYQCDADVVGSKSLWQEVEFIQLYDTVFSALKLKGVTIKINNRKILSGIADIIGAEEKLTDFTVALDKLDKIGRKAVLDELERKEFSSDQISFLSQFIDLKDEYDKPLNRVDEILKDSEIGREGVNDLRKIFSDTEALGLNCTLEFDVTLARGLNYYTGAIFEVAAPETVKMGSIGGGGRYDDLTGIFGMKDVSGVGISFGLDRIYLVLEELNLFPEAVNRQVEVLFINFGDKEALFSLKAIKALRSKGIHAELYPDAAKMKKQMNHANKRHIPFVVLVGEEEVNSNTYTLKNMGNGEQLKLNLNDLIAHIK